MTVQTIPHIQEMLDEFFPGVRLEYNPFDGFWALTDFTYHPNGARADNVYSKPSRLHLPICGTNITSRRIVWKLIDDDGNPVIPCRDQIHNALAGAFVGGREEAGLQHVLDVEKQEDKEEEEAQAAQRDAMREMARNAWNRSVDRVISTPDGYTDNRKIDKDIERRMREESELDAEIEAHFADSVKSGAVAYRDLMSGGRG